MEELSRDEQIVKNYTEVVENIRKKYPGIEGVKIDVSTEDKDISLSIGEHKVYMTARQAVDLMKELRRAVIKINPKVLYKK